METHADRPPVERVLYGPYGLRAGWRILLYVLLVFGLASSLATLLRAARVPWSFTLGGAVTLAAALVAGWLMLAFVDRRPMGALGLALEPAAARDSVVGFGLGAGGLGVAVALLAVAGSARWVADSGTAPEYVATLVQALGFFAVAAAMEEVLFRGYAFQALVQGIGAWPAAVLTSALFSAAHLGNLRIAPVPPAVAAIALANIFIAGVMLAVAYLKTRSLWFATGVHLGWNWAMSALLDFPVSGLARDTPLYSAVETGADWWTGGRFGPEAGLAATLAVVLLTAWMLRTRRLGESARMRAARPLVDDRLGDRWP